MEKTAVKPKKLFIAPHQKFKTNLKNITKFLEDLKDTDNPIRIGYQLKTPEPDQLYSVLFRGGDPVIILRMERAYIIERSDKLVRYMFEKKVKLYE